MDDSRKDLSTRRHRRDSVALLRENLYLRDMVAGLQQRMGEESEANKDGAGQLRVLREANEHLVLATFSATDLQAAAELTNERQTEFLSMLAHELRDPIASISFASAVMRGAQVNSAKLDTFIDIIGRQSFRMMRLVDDLLDVSRIRTGKLTLQLRDGVLEDILESAIATARPAMEQRAQSVRFAMPGAPTWLHADHVRLAQLFSNLLVNASKFSPSNTTLHVTAVLQETRISVTIRDEGKGIAAADAARMFELFEQGPDEAGHMAASGLGIGLSLVRSIATLHGGSVSVASAGVGQGCAFTVLLPLRFSAEGPHPTKILAEGN